MFTRYHGSIGIHIVVAMGIVLGTVGALPSFVGARSAGESLPAENGEWDQRDKPIDVLKARAQLKKYDWEVQSATLEVKNIESLPRAIPQISVVTPSYPIGVENWKVKLVAYQLQETGNVSGTIISRTSQFFTQYDVPLSEPLGPYSTIIHVAPLQTNEWNEPVRLDQEIIRKARALDEYALVLKTTYAGISASGGKFNTEASLLLLLPPAAFSKASPADGASVPTSNQFLQWNSSVGAIDYEYCFDTVNNNKCDTNWIGMYWLSTYNTNAALQDLPQGTTFYWQVRANNMAGFTPANNGIWWSFTTCSSSLTVVNTNDSGPGSLRQALIDSCQAGTIKFAPILAGQTITLETDLVFSKDVTLDGSGLSSQVIISGGNIAHLKVLSGLTVLISDLTIINSYGSGIESNGNLTLVNSTLKNNRTTGDGGAIYSSGTLTIRNSTLTQNQAAGQGGAIFIGGNTTDNFIVNSTIIKNQADDGGGISMRGNAELSITNSTLTGNTAPHAAEFWVAGFTYLKLYNTIIACVPENADCYDYSVNQVALTDSIVVVDLPENFGLAELANNGGPTQTMALLPNSPLINAGNNINCPATDQRGVTRPQETHCDIGAYESQDAGRFLAADFNGDGKTDVATFRPSNGTWYLSGQGRHTYGQVGDMPVPADYNGDGKDEIAVFRSSNSMWYIRGQGSFVYGMVGDIPVVADYNGDGKDDIAVFRPTNSTWYIHGIGAFVYGQAGDIPAVADYNGDGKADIAVFRPTNSTWYIRRIGPRVYGTVGDIPVIADYNGDGKADIAVFRPTNSTWYIYGVGPKVYGTVGDLPVVGDYNGDGRADVAVFRPTNSTWYIYSVGPSVYGAVGDIPV